jgi:hypothetical protein
MNYQQELANTFCDMHKSLHGCRARFCYDWSVEELESGIARLDQQIQEELNYEKQQRENLASECHVSVEQIVEWERGECSGQYVEVNRDFIESLPVEPYEWAHELEVAA